MTKHFKVKTILKEIDCPYLSLYDGGRGYWYFVFDDTDAGIFEDLSVVVFKLNHLDFSKWVETGREFVELCEAKRG